MKENILAIIFTMFFCCIAYSQELPKDEIQAMLNGYFDNFGVKVIYPEVSFNKSIFTNTSINGIYLVDIITAASMKSKFDSVYSYINKEKAIDAYTSATKRTHGGGDDNPDELRHQFNFGITQIIGDLTFSLNNMYSTEHDYSSETVAASVSMPFAKKNSIINLGFVISWDKSFPQIRYWESTKDVYSYNLGYTQIFSTDFLIQFSLFYSNTQGLLFEPYQAITIADFENKSVHYYESRYPSSRDRYAAGLRAKYRLGEYSSLEVGYRYYDDDWDIRSHTINGLYMHKFFDDDLIVGIGLRSYLQSAAYFYKDVYSQEEQLMTVDAEMKKLSSNEIQLSAILNGEVLPVINSSDFALLGRLHYFIRHTDSPDWHSRMKNLCAVVFSLGVKVSL